MICVECAAFLQVDGVRISRDFYDVLNARTNSQLDLNPIRKNRESL